MPNEEMASRALPQPPNVATTKVIIAVVAFLGFVALSMAGLFFYIKASAPAALKPPAERRFPQPALQTAPQEDLKRFEREQREALSGYGWVDRTQGLVTIPIEDAMRIIASRGDNAYDPLDEPKSSVAAGNSGEVHK